MHSHLKDSLLKANAKDSNKVAAPAPKKKTEPSPLMKSMLKRKKMEGKEPEQSKEQGKELKKEPKSEPTKASKPIKDFEKKEPAKTEAKP